MPGQEDGAGRLETYGGMPIGALVCPRDRGALEVGAGPVGAGPAGLRCVRCQHVFPVVGNVPVLINDDNSVFAIADYAGGGGYDDQAFGRSWDRRSGLKQLFDRFQRRLRDVNTSMRYLSPDAAIAQTRAMFPNPRILVIGSGGSQYGEPGDTVVLTDVGFGPHVQFIADAHDLPFADGSFHLVICIAVLEHVADPQRCVSEFVRVLASGGFIYANTPFLQPVHMGAYDFTRFTPLGHRRLFRWFDTIDAGPSLGVGTVLGWSLIATAEAVPLGRLVRSGLSMMGLLMLPVLKQLDRFLTAPAHLDGAGGNYFFGRKRAAPVTDREMIKMYRGGYKTPA